MNRVDRMMAILLEIQRKGRCRAEDLAALFETSKRTIYRDIQALSEAGVPMVAVPGQGYSLMDGYFLPPISFTTEEAMLLLLGCEYISHHFDKEYKQTALQAGEKIEHILTKDKQEQVQAIRERVRFLFFDNGRADSEQIEDFLRLLRRAVLEKKRARFIYYKHLSTTQGGVERTVDPLGLVCQRGTWYVAAFCHLREEMRLFRLDRMSGLVLLDQTYQSEENFSFCDYRPMDNRQIVVRVRVQPDSVRWVKETLPYYAVDESSEPDGGLIVTLRIRKEEDVMGWILGWGARMEVLEPSYLKQKVLEEAQSIIHLYTSRGC